MEEKNKYKILKELWNRPIVKSSTITLLVIANFLLAGVVITFQFVLVVLLFTYLAVAGILFKKSTKEHKIYRVLNGFITLQKIIAWFFLAVIVLGVIGQLYLKIKG